MVISGDSTENVTFLSGALSGGLSLADTAADSAGYGGTVSGFGGLNNTDTTQFIDLTSVTYSAGEVSASYAANASHPTSGGVLTVTSSGVTVADISLAGNYTHAAFDVVSGANNTVEIVDPASFIAGGGTATLASPANDTSVADQPCRRRQRRAAGQLHGLTVPPAAGSGRYPRCGATTKPGSAGSPAHRMIMSAVGTSSMTNLG